MEIKGQELGIVHAALRDYHEAIKDQPDTDAEGLKILQRLMNRSGNDITQVERTLELIGWGAHDGSVLDVRSTGFDEPLKIEHRGYTSIITFGEGFQENEIAFTFTCWQSGHTKWMMTLTECDGEIYYRTGLCRTIHVTQTFAKAIAQLTREAGWTNPIN